MTIQALKEKSAKLDAFIAETQCRLDIYLQHVDRGTNAVQTAEDAWKRSRDTMLEYVTHYKLVDHITEEQRKAFIKAGDWEEFQQALIDAASTARPV